MSRGGTSRDWDAWNRRQRLRPPSGTLHAEGISDRSPLYKRQTSESVESDDDQLYISWAIRDVLFLLWDWAFCQLQEADRQEGTGADYDFEWFLEDVSNEIQGWDYLDLPTHPEDLLEQLELCGDDLAALTSIIHDGLSMLTNRIATIYQSSTSGSLGTAFEVFISHEGTVYFAELVRSSAGKCVVKTPQFRSELNWNLSSGQMELTWQRL